MSDFLAMLSSTPLAAGNAPYVEALYEQFLADPSPSSRSGASSSRDWAVARARSHTAR